MHMKEMSKVVPEEKEKAQIGVKVLLKKKVQDVMYGPKMMLRGMKMKKIVRV